MLINKNIYLLIMEQRAATRVPQVFLAGEVKRSNSKESMCSVTSSTSKSSKVCYHKHISIDIVCRQSQWISLWRIQALWCGQSWFRDFHQASWAASGCQTNWGVHKLCENREERAMQLLQDRTNIEPSERSQIEFGICPARSTLRLEFP